MKHSIEIRAKGIELGDHFDDDTRAVIVFCTCGEPIIEAETVTLAEVNYQANRHLGQVLGVVDTRPGNPLDDCPTCGRRISDMDPNGCEAVNGQRYCIPHFMATYPRDAVQHVVGRS